MIKKVGATLLTLALAVACGSDENQRPGEQSVYERIDGLTDCIDLQSEFDMFMAVFDANEPGTERAVVAVAYAEAAETRMQEINC